MIGIKDMQMPKNCNSCRFGEELDTIWYTCHALVKDFANPNGILKPDECPLVEIEENYGKEICDRT